MMKFWKIPFQSFLHLFNISSSYRKSQPPTWQLKTHPGKVHSKGVIGSVLPSWQLASVTFPVKLGPQETSQLSPAKTLRHWEKSTEQGTSSGRRQEVLGAAEVVVKFGRCINMYFICIHVYYIYIYVFAYIYIYVLIYLFAYLQIYIYIYCNFYSIYGWLEGWMSR